MINNVYNEYKILYLILNSLILVMEMFYNVGVEFIFFIWYDNVYSEFFFFVIDRGMIGVNFNIIFLLFFLGVGFKNEENLILMNIVDLMNFVF